MALPQLPLKEDMGAGDFGKGTERQKRRNVSPGEGGDWKGKGKSKGTAWDGQKGRQQTVERTSQGRHHFLNCHFSKYVIRV